MPWSEGFGDKTAETKGIEMLNRCQSPNSQGPAWACVVMAVPDRVFAVNVPGAGATLDAREAHELTVINERPLLHLLPIRSNAPVLLR